VNNVPYRIRSPIDPNLHQLIAMLRSVHQ
jgi:hypothetical protein